jgi:hypothetical protein
MAAGVAPRLELLEVGELADVDLLREVPPDRLLERLVGAEPTAGERPGAQERLLRALPEEHLERAVAHLEDDRQDLVRERRCARLLGKFSTGSHKPSEDSE